MRTLPAMENELQFMNDALVSQLLPASTDTTMNFPEKSLLLRLLARLGGMDFLLD